MNARRFFSAAGVVAVAGVAGAISYRHQEHLAATHGQGSLAVIWPLCVDGLIVVTSIATSTDRAAGYRARVWAVAGFWIGVLVSVTTNWLATSGGLVNHSISAFPALAFLLAVESLSSKPRTRKVARVSAEVTLSAPAYSSTDDLAVRNGSATTISRPATPAKPRKVPTKAAAVAAAARRMPGATATEIAAKAGTTERTARRHLEALKATQPMSPLDGTVPTSGGRINGTDVLAEIGV